VTTAPGLASPGEQASGFGVAHAVIATACRARSSARMELVEAAGIELR
jgi:hypothetical protein